MREELEIPAAPDEGVVLEEDAAAPDELVELDDSTAPESSGVMDTVELLTHSLDGKRVALLVNVISAHYWTQWSVEYHAAASSALIRCKDLHHCGQQWRTGVTPVFPLQLEGQTARSTWESRGFQVRSR